MFHHRRSREPATPIDPAFVSLKVVPTLQRDILYHIDDVRNYKANFEGAPDPKCSEVILMRCGKFEPKNYNSAYY